jgi:DNA-binding MarR family transcriptional regulator
VAVTDPREPPARVQASNAEASSADVDSAQTEAAERATEAGHALLRLGSRLHRLYAETIEGLSTPLSVPQFRILERVGLGVASLGQLAELARRQPPTISKSVDSLVRQGLLARAEAASDRRATALSLTPRGAALLREAHAELDRLARWLAAAATDLGDVGDPGNLAAFAVGLYEKTEAELDLLVEARRTPGRAPRLARPAGATAPEPRGQDLALGTWIPDQEPTSH